MVNLACVDAATTVPLPSTATIYGKVWFMMKMAPKPLLLSSKTCNTPPPPPQSANTAKTYSMLFAHLLSLFPSLQRVDPDCVAEINTCTLYAKVAKHARLGVGGRGIKRKASDLSLTSSTQLLSYCKQNRDIPFLSSIIQMSLVKGGGVVPYPSPHPTPQV